MQASEARIGYDEFMKYYNRYIGMGRAVIARIDYRRGWFLLDAHSKPGTIFIRKWMKRSGRIGWKRKVDTIDAGLIALMEGVDGALADEQLASLGAT